MEAWGVLHLWKPQSIHLKTEKECLQVFFLIWEYSAQEPMEEQEGVLPKSFSSADSKVLHSAIHSYPPRLHWNKKLPGPVCWIWPLEYISGMSYETLHLALNLLGISCIYAFCLQICSFVAVAFRMPHVRYDYYNPSLIVCTEEFLKYVPFTYKTHVKITDGWRKMLLCCSFLCFHRQVSE